MHSRSQALSDALRTLTPLLGLLMVGCQVTFPDGLEISCSDGACPDGYQCNVRQNLCVRDLNDDAGSDRDASLDTSLDAADAGSSDDAGPDGGSDAGPLFDGGPDVGPEFDGGTDAGPTIVQFNFGGSGVETLVAMDTFGDEVYVTGETGSADFCESLGVKVPCAVSESYLARIDINTPRVAWATSPVADTLGNAPITPQGVAVTNGAVHVGGIGAARALVWSLSRDDGDTVVERYLPPMEESAILGTDATDTRWCALSRSGSEYRTTCRSDGSGMPIVTYAENTTMEAADINMDGSEVWAALTVNDQAAIQSNPIERNDTNGFWTSEGALILGPGETTGELVAASGDSVSFIERRGPNALGVYGGATEAPFAWNMPLGASGGIVAHDMIVADGVVHIVGQMDGDGLETLGDIGGSGARGFYLALTLADGEVQRLHAGASPSSFTALEQAPGGIFLAGWASGEQSFPTNHVFLDQDGFVALITTGE